MTSHRKKLTISEKIEMIVPRPADTEPAKQIQMLLAEEWEKIRMTPGYSVEDVDEVFVEPLDEKIKIVCMSDTHSTIHSADFEIPDGDIFIHAGDFTRYGLISELEEFNTWLGDLPHPHKLVIAGNHELCLDEDTLEEAQDYMDQVGEMSTCSGEVKALLTNCTYLEDQAVDILGIRIYGSPWQPLFSHSAFNLPRGEDLLAKWRMIPSDTDILVTHAPPLGVRDAAIRPMEHGGHGQPVRTGRAGCQDLLVEVVERVKPRFHIFGHIHEGYGCSTNGETVFMNASTCTRGYQPINKPLVLFYMKKWIAPHRTAIN